MKNLNTLSILGVGFMGGSLARTVKKKRLAEKIIGFGRRKSALDMALRSDIIDEAAASFPEAVKEADLVVIAAPVSLFGDFIEKCELYCKAGVIITDVGSTKSEIVKKAEDTLGSDKFFVGAHPMAGSEKRGFEFSQENLFDNSICFLTKSGRTEKRALEKVDEFWKAAGAKTVIVSPKRHDEITAEISHLPHILAFSLVNYSRNIEYAGNSFRDMTRVASSDADMWLDIFFSNKENVVKSMDKFMEYLEGIKAQIKNLKRKELRKKFEKAKLLRGEMDSQ